MKRLFFSVILILISIYAYGQSAIDLGKRRISLSLVDESPKAIIHVLENELNCKFSYNPDQLAKRKFTIAHDSLSLYAIMDSIFVIDHLQLRWVGEQVVVYSRNLRAQPLDTCRQSIGAVLLDELTDLPVSHALIRELQSDQMTLTNRDGRFNLSIPCNLDKIQIEVSAMGYHSQLIERSMNSKITPIRMQGDYITLQEVVILSIPAQLLIERVLKKVDTNYLNQPTNAQSFFREAILKNGNVAKLSEAVFEVYNRPYSGATSMDQVKMIKGRKFVSSNQNDTLDFKIKGSLKSCFDLDVVKYQPYFFNLETYKDYEYSFEDVVVFNNRNIYVIGFEKSKGPGLPYEGKMYIDKEQLALVSIDFELKKSAMRGSDEKFVFKKSKGTKIKFQNAQYHVNYTDVDGKFAMNYVGLRTSFKVRNKKGLFAANYETISEYVVNQITTENAKRIRSKDQFSASRIFMDQPLEYNENYWRGINFLPIDKSLKDSSEELNKLIRTPKE
ncbi:MAG: hypothetical protein JXR07_06595 [Reichenbachiella sp.]